ncbi:TrmB family transcriptional regulator [Halogeometricum limi]|uniref:Sugar-specific transcriptional regulator TrmB n=1 Tax=Halogeometricum limi TaxID=555875 RepID=A0A1I6GYH9_9EURY|nr:helix-turn-helix domain-containing protein [Halogeometricum limi]SFR47107.1 Sugar-specific transcriptional regulator TrmB [Halogeometricum limi]
MPTYQSETATENAVGALSSLGLTSYEAKCYVALLRLGRGTAREVADVSTVPRSRVYDAMKSLHEQGFVDIEYSNPRTYQPVSLERALELISSRREDHETALREAAAHLPATDVDDGGDDDGVWTVAKHDHVRDRESRLLDAATDRVLAYARAESLTQPFLGDVARLLERGVEVTLLVDSEAARRRAVDELGEDAAVVNLEESLRLVRPDDGDSGHVARAFSVDYEAAMVVSAEVNGHTGTRRESAVWSRGNGPGIGFVHLVTGTLDAATR